MKILEVLSDQWVFDVQMMSHWWFWLLVIPAMFYLPFMVLKWLLLTCPVWLPLSIIFNSLRSDQKDETK